MSDCTRQANVPTIPEAFRAWRSRSLAIAKARSAKTYCVVSTTTAKTRSAAVASVPCMLIAKR